MKRLNLMAAEISKLAHEKGWYDQGGRSFGDHIALIHSEVSEALEAYRTHGTNEWRYNDQYGQPEDKPEGVASELADTIIRILDLCGYYGIDIEAAIEQKHEYNKTRPYRHGGKKL